MAPLWKVMLSKSSPLYRDALFSFSLWEWKAQERELLLLRKHSDRERKVMLAQLDKLSKELQQKDKVIESLRVKLNQHPRSDTPCSSHALSDTTDQSDRISYVSDGHGSTNEDLGSDPDAASEPGPEETRAAAAVGTDDHCHHGNMSQYSSAPPSIISSHQAPSCLSCPSMLCSSSPHRPQTGFSTPTSRPLPGFSCAPQQPADFLPLSYSGFQSSPFRSFGTGSLDLGSAMKARAGLLESSALWDTAYGTRPAGVGADLSSGSSGYQSGPNNAGSELMKEHLKEVRGLRQRLEDSIQTNDRLRQQLEERLAGTASEKGAPTNIYIQSLDSAIQLSSQIRVLKEENVDLQARLQKVTREGSKEAEQLREAVLLEQSRLKEAELNSERWAGQNRILLGEAEAQAQEIIQLRQDRQKNQETVNRLQHEVVVLQQQLNQNHSLVRSLQSQLQASVCERTANTHSGQLRGETEPGPGDPDLQTRLESSHLRFPPPPPPPSVQRQADERRADHPGDSIVHPDGGHVVGRGGDVEALQRRVLEGTTLLLKMEATIHSLALHLHQPSEFGGVRRLLSDAKTLKRLLQETDSLLRRFWRAALPDSEEPKQDQYLREEVASLRLKLSDQERALRDTTERLKSSNLTKDSMEHFILGQLSRTRDVLQKAKTNLKVRALGASVTSPSLLVGVS